MKVLSGHPDSVYVRRNRYLILENDTDPPYFGCRLYQRANK